MKHTLHQTKLNSGTRILFVNVPGSRSYYFNTICNAGYNYASYDKFELPHLLEHLAFEGSKKFPELGQMSYELERLGGWYNAYTDTADITYFLIGSIVDYRKITELGLEQYTSPLFRPKNIAEQKKVVEREFKRSIDNDDDRIRNLTMSRLFPDRPVFAQQRIDTLKGISKDDIESYYKATHTQANTVFVISGDLDSSKQKVITEMIAKSLSALPVGKRL